MDFPRKSAVALAVAATCAGGVMTSAYAAQTTTNNVGVTTTTYATEAAIGGQLSQAPVSTLHFTTNEQFATGHTFTVYVELSGGATWKTKPASSDVTLTPNNASGTAVNPSSANITLNSDHSVLAIQFDPSQTIPSGSTLTITGSQGSAGGADYLNLNAASALQTPGGQVTASFAVDGNPVTSPISYPSGSSDTGLGVVAESQQAIQIHVVSSGSFASEPVINGTDTNNGTAETSNETAQINVNATPPLSNVTGGLGTNAVDFGAVYLTNASNTAYTVNSSNALTPYTVSNDTGNIKITATGNFLTNGQETFVLNADPTCAGSTTYGSQVPTSGSSVNLTATFGSGGDTASSPVYDCMTIGSPTSGNAVQLPTTQPQITSLQVLDQAGNVVDSLTSPVSLYNLQANQASISLMNYVPAAAAPYMTYIRVVNTGSAQAPITVTLTGQDGSTLGSGTLGTLAPGASQTYSASQVESAAGVTLNAGQRPRVLLTAPTSNLSAQTYLGNGNGGFTNMTSSKTFK